MHARCAKAARVCDGCALQSRACAQLLAFPRRARCVSRERQPSRTGSTLRRASGEKDQHPGEPLANMLDTPASLASDQVFTVHLLENAEKLLQKPGGR